MLGKKNGSFKNLAIMAKIRSGDELSQSAWLLNDDGDETKRRRFVVPTGYLSHPLFKIMLEKSSEEFGFTQKNGMVVPCSVNDFQEMVSVVESCKGKCDLSNLIKEFV
ncbi:auxin-induced protein 15A-like protein [Tanacetum coccineum]